MRWQIVTFEKRFG